MYTRGLSVSRTTSMYIVETSLLSTYLSVPINLLLLLTPPNRAYYLGNYTEIPTTPYPYPPYHHSSKPLQPYYNISLNPLNPLNPQSSIPSIYPIHPLQTTNHKNPTAKNSHTTNLTKRLFYQSNWPIPKSPG